MSYTLIKKGVGDLLEELKLSPSKELDDFNDVSPNEYNNTYILKPLTGELDDIAQETLADRIYDIQNWSIQIAFARGVHTGQANRDQLHRKREDIIQKLDNPANWSSFTRMLKYNSWEIIESVDYVVLIIILRITDTITY